MRTGHSRGSLRAWRDEQGCVDERAGSQAVSRCEGDLPQTAIANYVYDTMLRFCHTLCACQWAVAVVNILQLELDYMDT